MIFSFGQRLKQLRVKNNLTQKELGERIGYKLRMIQFLEADEREPNLSTINKICDIFNCSADYLLGRIYNEEDVLNRRDQLMRIQVACRAIQEYWNTPNMRVPFSAFDEYADAMKDAGYKFEKGFVWGRDGAPGHVQRTLDKASEEFKKIDELKKAAP